MFEPHCARTQSNRWIYETMEAFACGSALKFANLDCGTTTKSAGEGKPPTLGRFGTVCTWEPRPRPAALNLGCLRTTYRLA